MRRGEGGGLIVAVIDVVIILFLVVAAAAAVVVVVAAVVVVVVVVVVVPKPPSNALLTHQNPFLSCPRHFDVLDGEMHPREYTNTCTIYNKLRPYLLRGIHAAIAW